MISHRIIIPINLCFEALNNKKVRDLQVFVWLKMHSSGKIIITTEVLHKMKTDLGIKSVKTVKSSLSKLEMKKWITRSPKSGFYFIKSFERIRISENYIRRTGAEFNITDIKNFKGFLVSAVISHMISIQKRRLWKTERSKRGSITVFHKPHLFFPIANEALAKIFGISISTAYEWKKLAAKQGFIKIRKNFEKVQNVTPAQINDFKKYGSLPADHLRIRKGKVVLQKPDLVFSKVQLRKRAKLMLYMNK